jgi:activating signal cointegrator 1
MKALTLWQPWASLIVMGHKQYETRSWKRDSLIGERIAIHAAKRPPKDLPRDLLHELTTLKLVPSGLPLGAVLGTGVVTDFHQTELLAPSLTRREIAFGDYAAGRWAWRLDDVKMLPEPEPARGRQGIWNRTPPKRIAV